MSLRALVQTIEERTLADLDSPRSVLTRLSIPLATVLPFVLPLALNTPDSMPPNEPPVSSSAQLPAWLAIEFLADAKSQEAEKEKKKEVGEEAAVVSSVCRFSFAVETSQLTLTIVLPAAFPFAGRIRSYQTILLGIPSEGVFVTVLFDFYFCTCSLSTVVLYCSVVTRNRVS